MLLTLKPIKDIEKSGSRKDGSIPQRCSPQPKRTFSELMDGEWEELVITLDKAKNQYEFKTACCPGAQVC